MKTIYVLGAGPAGLAVVDGLSKAQDVKVILIDSSMNVGGLAQTLVWEGNGKHDLGPHKLFTTDPELEKKVRGLLENKDWLLRPKKSRIFMKGHFLPYPPSPFSVVKLYGMLEFFGMGIDFVLAKVLSIFPKKSPETFESDLSGRVGRRLYERMFKPIAMKLWGDPACLDAKLSKSRVQTPSLMQLLAKSLGFKHATQATEAFEFFYPMGGLQRLWHAIIARSPNVEVLTGHKVTGITFDKLVVRKIKIVNTQTALERIIDIAENDFVVSTLPLSLTVNFMEAETYADAHKSVNSHVVLNDLLLVFLKIKKKRLMEDSWVFIPDGNIPFHRVSEQAAFDPGMSPNGSIVCCEIMSHSARPFFDSSDEQLRIICVKNLKTMGFDTGDSDEWKSRVIRLPKSYPVYKSGYEEGLGKVMSVLDSMGNFKSIGRQGSFNYIGSLDAMDIGYGFSKWLLNDYQKENQEAKWTIERLRTSHFPVLD